MTLNSPTPRNTYYHLPELCIAILIFTVTIQVYARPQVEWERVYYCTEDCVVREVVPCEEGYVLVGNMGGWRDEEAFVVLVDWSGLEVWRESFGVLEGPVFGAVPGQGGMVVSGVTMGGGYMEAARLIKIDFDGEVVWERLYGAPRAQFEGSVVDPASCIAASSDGGYGVVGIGFFRQDRQEYYLFKTDREGYMTWNITLGVADRSVDPCLVSDGGGGFMVALGRDIYHVDPGGGVVWNGTFGSSGKDWFSAITACGHGRYLAAGYAGRSRSAYLVMFEGPGNILWEEEYGSPETRVRDLVTTGDGGFLLVGSHGALPGFERNVYMVKVNAHGEREWERTLDSNGGAGYSISRSPRGGYVIGGSRSTSSNGKKAYLAKLEGSPIKEVSLKPGTVTPGIDREVLIEVGIDPDFPGWGQLAGVWANLTGIGQPDLVPLYDDGTHGDEQLGDRTYSRMISIDPDLDSGRILVPAEVADIGGRNSSMNSYLYILPSHDEVVYDEGEEWTIIPESATIYPKSTQNVFQGNYSLYILPDAGGYLDLVPPESVPFDTFGYKSMEMEINPGYSERFYPRIDLEIKGRDRPLHIDLRGMDYTFREDNWTHITVPLVEVNAANRHLDHIRLTGTIDGPYYMDDLKLVKTTSQGSIQLPAITIFSMALLIPILSKRRTPEG